MADAGFKLAVEGEREFKKAISEINAQIKANAAELKLLTAQYDANDKSMTALNDKQGVLEEGLAAQGQKVSALREQYEKMASAYGENDTKVLKLKTDLANATAEYAEMSKKVKANQEAIDENWAAMENYREVTSRVGDTLGGLDEIMAQNRKAIEKLAEDYESLGESSRTAALREEALAEQNKLLANSVDNQQKKINALNEELDAAIRLYGDNSEEAREYKDAVHDATEELVVMEQQIEDNNEAMSKSDDAVSPLGGALDEILDKLGIQMPESLEKLSSTNGGFAKAAVAAGLITAAIVGAIGKLTELTKEAASWADETERRAQVSGIGVEKLQALEYAGKQLGVSMEVIEDVMKEIKLKTGEADEAIEGHMAEIEDLTALTQEEYDELTKLVNSETKLWDDLGVGIYTNAGKIRDADEIFYEMIDALAGVTNEAERLNIMNQLLGESSKDLAPFIAAGSDAIRELEQEARDLGLVIEQETVSELDELQREIDLATDKWNVFLTRLGATGGVVLEVVRGENGLDSLRESLEKTLVPLDSLSEQLFGEKTGELVSDWWNTKGLGALLNSFKQVPDLFVYLVKKSGGNIFFPAYANGTYNHTGGYALVGEKGPEIVELPRGSRVYPSGQIPGTSVSNIYNVTIDAKNVREFNDVVRIAQTEKQSIRMGYIKD